MRCISLFCVGLLLFVSKAAPAQDEDLIDDLPPARKEAAARTKQKSKQPKVVENSADALPPVTQPNTDLIDDLSPAKKRAAADRAEGSDMRVMRPMGGMGGMMEARKFNMIPDTLGEALARALHNSPAILVAEAKVRQAQAELNEVRQTVVHDLTVAFKRRAHNIDRLPQGDPDVREAVLEDEAKIIYLLGLGGEPRFGLEFSVAQGNLPAIADKKGAQGATREPALDGVQMPDKPAAGMMGGMMSAMMGRAPAEAAATSDSLGNLPEKMRRFLDARVDLAFANQSISDVLTYLAQAGSEGEVDFVIYDAEDWEGVYPAANVNMSLKQITVAAALQALADLNRCAFIFRDYGILVLGPSDDPHTDAAAMLESFRASRAPMIAPPRLAGEAVEAMDTATGAGGIIGPDGTGTAVTNPPADSPAEKQKNRP